MTEDLQNEDVYSAARAEQLLSALERRARLLEAGAAEARRRRDLRSSPASRGSRLRSRREPTTGRRSRSRCRRSGS